MDIDPTDATYVDLKSYEGYYHAFDKSYTVTIKNSNDSMLNKIYHRDDDEVSMNDWVIKVVNMPGEPDILNYFGKSEISLQEIVDFLKLMELIN